MEVHHLLWRRCTRCLNIYKWEKKHDSFLLECPCCLAETLSIKSVDVIVMLWATFVLSYMGEGILEDKLARIEPSFKLGMLFGILWPHLTQKFVAVLFLFELHCSALRLFGQKSPSCIEVHDS